MILNLKQLLNWLTRPLLIKFIILVIFGSLVSLILIFPIAIRPSSYAMEIGSVAQQDIQAPRTLSYVSEVSTEQAKKDAEKNVSSIYLPADPTIARSQISKLQVALNYITNVRMDTYASREQKLADLLKLKDFQIKSNISEQILDLNDTRWQIIQDEALSVLEQVMRNIIRDDRLADHQRNVTSLISYSLPQDQAAIVAELVTPFVAPNSLYSQEQTEAARLQAREAIKPITRTFVKGETIVQRGQILNQVSWEALQAYNLVQPPNNNKALVAILAMVSLGIAIIPLFFYRFRNLSIENLRNLLLIVIILLVFLYVARVLVPNRTIVPYLFPVPAFALTISCLLSMEAGVIFALVLSIFTGYGLDQGSDLTIYYFLTSLCGLLALGKGRRVSTFFWAGLIIGAAGTAVILAHRLNDSSSDWIGLLTLVGSAFLNGITSASVALLLQHFFAQLLGITTPLQLLEISRPDHPLLQLILRNAPGTYQHSLQVANLAERAAELIGADSLLTRVGAIFHDVGKTNNPSFFIENLLPGQNNPHNGLDPTTSASIIIDHVTDAIQLAHKHHIPPRIQDFILEHHGTLLTRYQYTKAVQAVGNHSEFVNLEAFRYPGPKPRSKETALVMLADQCEARARADLPTSEAQLRQLVKEQFEMCQREGQLSNTTLTLRDLNIAAESFVNTLQNTLHLRIKYPRMKPESSTHTNNSLPPAKASDEKLSRTIPLSKTFKPPSTQDQ